MKTQDFTRRFSMRPGDRSGSLPDGFEVVNSSQVMQALRYRMQLQDTPARARAARQFQHQCQGSRVKVPKRRTVHTQRLRTQSR
jgi:hypothetical protein